MDIPIRNLYGLLLYAWDRLEEGEVVEVGDLDAASAADLLGRVLASGTRHVLRRGLDRGYQTRTEPTSRLRGRIEFVPSVRAMLLPQGRAICTSDELTPDVLTNQILRSTLARLWRVDGLDDGIRREVSQAHRLMDGVREVRITRALFGRVRLHANNAFYRFLLAACALVHENLLADETGDSSRFRDFVRDDRQMAALFERFVLQFYRHHRPDLRPSATPHEWTAETLHARGPGQLPRMLTDITLRGDGWSTVIDAKYYREALKSGTFESGNLYQILAYLRAMRAAPEASGEPAGNPASGDVRTDGVLLYPTVRQSFDHAYQIGEHRVRLLTVDLAAEWDEIERTLLGIPAWSETRLAHAA